MILKTKQDTLRSSSFPRVSGDDPSPLAAAVALAEFSPRERG